MLTIFSDGKTVQYSVTNYLAPSLLLCRPALVGAQLGSDGFYLFSKVSQHWGQWGQWGQWGGGTTV